MFALPAGLGLTKKPGAGFLPSDISGLVLWLEADAITGLSDSDPVATWLDASGQGNNATQEAASQKPTWKATAGPNGKPTVRFDGADDFYYVNEALVAGLGTNLTSLCVHKATSGSNYRGMVGNHAGGPPRGLVFGQYEDGPMGFGYGDGASFGHGVYGTRAVATTWLSSCTFEAGVGVRLWKNGDADGTDLDGSTLVHLEAAAGFFVGRAFPSNDRFWSGDITAILLYNALLSTANRQSVESYLNDKYAIY